MQPETPTGDPAGLKRRFAALLVDRLIILGAGLFPVFYVEARVALLPRIIVDPYFPPLFVPWLLSVYLFYVLLAEGLCGGQTPGKRLLRIRVVDEEGRPIGLRAGLVRNLLRLADSIPLSTYAVGILLHLRRGARLGDLAAGSRVVRNSSPAVVRRAHLLAALLLLVVLPNVLLPYALRGGEAPRAAEGPFLRGVVVSNWSHDPRARGRVLDRIGEAGFNAIRFHDFKALPSPEVLREMGERNLTVILGTGESWTLRRGPEEARRMAALYGNESVVRFWAIGNEDYNPDLTIPRDHLRSVDLAFRASDPRPTTFANHMVLHAPDLLVAGFLGYGPVEFTDTLGFNAYPTGQAASWVELVRMWHNDTRRTVDPATGTFIDAMLGSYYALEPVLIEPIKKSTFGYGYWVHSYIAYGKLRGRPVFITEWGASPDPDYARGQWEVLRRFPELRGAFFYHWDHMDRGNDGMVDNESLFLFFKEEAR